MTTYGNDRFVIEYVKSVLKDDIPALPATMKKLIQQAILQRLTVDPIGFGKPLRYSLKGCRRLRVGDYRVVYQIDVPAKRVVILTIKHRKDVYD